MWLNYLFLRTDPDLVFGLFDAFLSTSDGDSFTVVSNTRHANFSCCDLLQIFQLLALFP